MLHRYLVPYSHCFHSLSKLDVNQMSSVPYLLGSFSNLLSQFHLLNQAELIAPFIYILKSVLIKPFLRLCPFLKPWTIWTQCQINLCFLFTHWGVHRA